MHNDQIQVLNGQFKTNLKLSKFDDNERDKVKPLYTYQQHRLFLKKNGVAHFENYEPKKKSNDDNQSQMLSKEE